jgi:hypothetical protein
LGLLGRPRYYKKLAPLDMQLEFQELTAQIATMRTEREKLLNEDSNPTEEILNFRLQFNPKSET